MIVCSCHAVSDAELRLALESGASAADVLRATRAGTDCGHCRDQVEELLAGLSGGGSSCCSGPPCPGCPRRGSA